MSPGTIVSSGRSDASTRTERLLAASKAFRPCLIYPRDIREQVRKFLDEEDYPPFGLHAARRIIPVLDAIAPILVSKESGEVFAVAVSVGNDGGLQIWIAGNGSDDTIAAKNYLQGVCDELVELRRKESSQPSTKMRNGTPRCGIFTFDDTGHLYQEIYNHCTGPVRKCAAKAKHLEMSRAVDNAISRVSSGDESDKKVARVLGIYGKVLELYDIYSSTASNEGLKNLYHGILLSAEAIRAFQKTGFNKDRLNDVGEQSLKEVNPGLKKQNVFEIFWDKAFELDNCVTKLLQLTLSRSMGKFLEKKITVKHVPSEKAFLTYDHTTDPYMLRVFGEMQEQDFVGSKADTASIRSERQKILGRDNTPMGERPTKLKDPFDAPHPGSMEAFVDHLRKHDVRESQSVSIEIHAESLLLLYLVENQIDAFPYIAVSKRCCLGCWLFVSAYNAVIRDKPNSRAYYVRGTHSKADNWVFPMSLTDAWRSLLADIEERMLLQVQQYFETTALAEGKRSHSLGAAGSSTGEQIHYGGPDVESTEEWEALLNAHFTRAQATA